MKSSNKKQFIPELTAAQKAQILGDRQIPVGLRPIPKKTVRKSKRPIPFYNLAGIKWDDLPEWKKRRVRRDAKRPII